MRPIAESTDLSPVLDKMRVIANQLLTNGRVRCSLNSTPATMKGAMDALGDFLSGVQKSAEPQHLVNDPGFVSASKKRTHLILPFSVHYASRSFPVPPFSHQDYATCRLLAKILSSKFLHREIREKGGAYGGGARVSHDGLFHFYSYRDPKSIETFEAFEKSVEWAVKGEFTAQDIDEAKLSVFSEIDKPVAPGEQGKRQFIYFVDDAMYQEHRQKLLGVTKEQLVETAKGYLTNEDKAVSTLLGPPSDVLEEKGWDVVSVAGEPDKRCARAV